MSSAFWLRALESLFPRTRQRRTSRTALRRTQRTPFTLERLEDRAMLSGTPLSVIPGTAGLWHLDEGAGGIAADAAGFNNGSLANGPLWVSGEAGYAQDHALTFDGVDDYVLLKNGPILGSAANFTVEAWVKWDGGGTTHPHQFIYSEGHYNDIIDLYLYDGVPSFTTLGTNWYTASAAAPLPVGQWHHLAGVLQAGVGGTLYVDGQPVATNPSMGPGSQYAGSTNIGRFAGNGSLRYFRGTIDEVRVLTVARTAAEIQADYQQGLGAAPEPEFVASGGFTFVATEGTLAASQTVATFTGPGGAEAVGNYAASIDWGDGGASSPGNISFNNNVFTVGGSHLYAAAGSNNVVTTISETSGGQSGAAWGTNAAMPTPRWASAAGAIDGVIYVAGGYVPGSHLQTVQAYDTATNTWINKNNKPAVQTNTAYGVIDGILYTAGGTNSSVEISSLYAYDPTTDTWTAKAAVPGVARQNSGGAVSGGLLYVMGGFSLGNPTNLNYAYNPASNTWSAPLAPLPTPRTGLAVAAVDGILYAIGGLAAGGVITNTVEAYDPVTNSWTTKAPLPTAREDFDVAVVDGIIYAVGGTDLTTQFATVEAYDPATNVWTTHASLPTARIALETVAVNGVIYAIGGYNNFPSGVALGTNESLTFAPAGRSVTAASMALVSAANHPPTAVAFGPYTVNEGGSLLLDGSHSWDPDQSAASLTYRWDLDGDGVFGETGIDAQSGDETGMFPTFSAAGLDGPSSVVISLQVTDDAGLSSTDSALIEITNWAPNANFSRDAEVRLGTPVTVRFSDANDLSPADVSAGFHYAFALDASGLAGATYANSGSDPSATFTFTDGLFQHTVYGRILDKDDGYNDYSTITREWLLTPPSPVEGISTGRIVVFTFSGDDGDSGTVGDGTIFWGDGTSSLASMSDGSITQNADGSFSAWGEHTYLEAATDLIFSVAGNDDPSGPAHQSFSALIDVTDAPLTLVSLSPPSPTAGVPTGSAVVATFRDANPFGTADDFSATITWGDGTTSTASAADGTITANADGSFSVRGQHTYAAAAANLMFAVFIQDDDGAMTGGSAVIQVIAPPTANSTPGKITGGGSIEKGVLNFGFTVQAKVENGVVTCSGNLEYQDKRSGLNLHATSITSVEINADGKHAMFSGTATLNGVAGYTFTVHVEDDGEGGSAVDKFRIEITGPSGFLYDSDLASTKRGVLDKGGNIQVHKPSKDK